MLPKLPRHDGAGTSPVVIVETDGLRLLEADRGNRRGNVNPTGPLPLALMLDVLASKLGARQIDGPIKLRFPATMCFRRSIEVPQAARRDIENMLAIDLERSMPFRPSDVLSGIDVMEKPDQPGILVAHNYLLKRKSVEPIADAIEQLGIAVAQVEVAAERGGRAVRLRSTAHRAQAEAPKSRTRLLNMILLATVVALGALAAYRYIDRHENALAALQQTTSILKAKAQARKAATSKTEAAVSQMASYASLRAEYVSRAAIIEELSRILPDTAWVADLKIDDSTVDISGQAKSATALLQLIESSPLFVDATLSTSVTFDPREGKERYSIRTRIENSQQAAQPSVSRP